MSKRFVEVPPDVTAIVTRSERELASDDVDPDKLEAVWGAAVRYFRTGTLPALALAVRHRGKLVLERSIGWARDGVLATPRTPFCTFSVSKAVTAVVMHVLDERDLLRLDDPVCEYIPEFARHGKEWVTLRHVLTHRAGIPSVTNGRASLEALVDREGIVAALCDEKPSFLPGRRLAYHAVTGGFILDEVARRVTGVGLDVLLERDIRAPLGFEYLSYGVPEALHGEVAVNAFTGYDVPFPFSRLIQRALGLRIEDAVSASNDPRWLSSVVPSGNVMATADDLARFFDLLLNGGTLDGHTVMQPRTIRRMLVESAYLEPDLTLGLAVRYGQGVMLGAYPFSLFGPGTPHAFGHYGLVSVAGWADPDREIALGLVTSGKAVIANQFPALLGLLRAISAGFKTVA